jgi:hypothetical protein
MSIKIAQGEIQRFLATKKPELLCITGKWGVGKTYSWSHYLLDARRENRIALNRYAYVSLFGQNSLDDLKYALFESTIPLDQLEGGPNLGSFEASLHFGEKWGRRLLQFSNVAPLGRAILSGAGRTLFLAVRDQIVCIDDLERHGKGLEVKDVLGMLSFLKEQRQCKIVLLLNDEKLVGDAQKDFSLQLEKVVDTRIAFVPTPQEAAAIGVSADASFREALVAHCVALGITNIRVIKKLEDLCERLRDLLEGFDPGVLGQAVQAVALFGWSHYQPDLAPPIDFVSAYNRTYQGYRRLAGKKNETTSEEKAWSALLADYGFSRADEFDLAVLKGIQEGYFDGDLLVAAGAVLNEQIEFRKKDNSFQAAWDLYHGSFEPNADEVLDKMTEKNFQQLFEASRGDELRGMVRAALNFGSFGNASDQMKAIAAQATAALREIGRQSPINARRILIYGINVEE